MPILNVDGISLYYSVKGKGIPIVFTHPPVLTNVNFKYQVEELSEILKLLLLILEAMERVSIQKNR